MGFRFGVSLAILCSICVRPLNAVFSTGWYGGGGSYRAMYIGDQNAFITRICLKTGSEMDSITVYFSNGATEGPYGGSGGDYYCYPQSAMTSGSCITAANLGAGSRIDRIQFVTKNGKLSHWYGGGGGTWYVINYDSSSECLSSLDVRVSSSRVTAIKFYFGSGRRAGALPAPDTVYPELDGPDPIYDHNDHPTNPQKPNEITSPNQYQYAFWSLLIMIK